MEIIDFHTHLVPYHKLTPKLTEFYSTINPEYFAKIKRIKDTRVTVEFLKEQGVKYAAVLAEYAPATTYDLTTEEVLDYCRGQEMLLPFANINPNTQPEPAKKLAEYVLDHEVKGLKLMPSYQFFYLNEQRIYPIYAKAEELKIPILIHIGSSTFQGTRMKYCDPIQLDDVAVDFPDLKIVMAHSGRGFWYDECFFLSTFHRNIYMEISGLPPRNLLNYFPQLEKNAEKVIFGSDWPAMPAGIKENVEEIKSLPLSDKAIEGILYKNAERILFG